MHAEGEGCRDNGEEEGVLPLFLTKLSLLVLLLTKYEIPIYKSKFSSSHISEKVKRNK